MAVNTTISTKSGSDFVPSWQQSPRKVRLLLGHRWKSRSLLSALWSLATVTNFFSYLLLLNQHSCFHLLQSISSVASPLKPVDPAIRTSVVVESKQAAICNTFSLMILWTMQALLGPCSKSRFQFLQQHSQKCCLHMLACTMQQEQIPVSPAALTEALLAPCSNSRYQFLQQ